MVALQRKQPTIFLRSAIRPGGAPIHLVDTSALDDMRGQMAAISKSQAVVEFTTEGILITANENFLHVIGYTLEEIKGRHHRMFVAPTVAESSEYRTFWSNSAAESTTRESISAWPRGGTRGLDSGLS